MKLIGLNNIKHEIDNLNEVPHIVFFGPRGTGKSTMAEHIAQRKNKKLITTVGKNLTIQKLLNVFVNLEEDDVLLIDEIHGLNRGVEEQLYIPMEKYKLPIETTSGIFQTLPLPKFTVIGTTTMPSKISKPLMSRFKITFQIPHYTLRELAQIIITNYPQISIKNALSISINTVTPREAINLAYRVVSLCKNENVNDNIVKNLEFIGYKYGLSKSERFYLKIVHNVGKISLTSLANALQIDKDEVKYVEDKLIRKGLIDISTKGRFLTVKGLLKIKQFKQ